MIAITVTSLKSGRWKVSSLGHRSLYGKGAALLTPRDAAWQYIRDREWWGVWAEGEAQNATVFVRVSNSTTFEVQGGDHGHARTTAPDRSDTTETA